MILKTIERAVRGLLFAWQQLSLDAKAVGGIATANWLLLFANHTTVGAERDVPLWQLFPLAAAVVFLVVTGTLAVTYPLRDRRRGPAFTPRARAVHLAAIVTAFVIVPTLASIILRETGRPYTYIHDGALMIEEASRKLLAGQNPYVADYLDTPLYYWPMLNNPALYHLTYFPLLFLITAPFVWAFGHLGAFWDERYLYLPAFVATLVIVLFLIRGTERRLSAVALVGLNPQLFPFVVEGRNDFFVLLFLFAGIALLQRERRALAGLAFAAGAAAKLHAIFILPFVIVYMVATKRPRTIRDAWTILWRPLWPAALLLGVTFLPFLLNDWGAFYDDVVRYNAGGAAWTYPISGMGFSALLLSLGVIPYRQADFPFAVIEIAVAAPIAVWSLRRSWRTPTIPILLGGYAATLLVFLFFGRYFQGNYLGYILAVATPIPFLRSIPRKRSRAARHAARSRTVGAPASASPLRSID